LPSVEVKYLKNPANGKTKNPQNLIGKLMINKQKYFCWCSMEQNTCYNLKIV